ncbi:MAG: hypothetical protein IJG65_06915 [Synergistaceae bacterium]|nr:hypothetical protein [Synergistaceae bacterium]
MSRRYILFAVMLVFLCVPAFGAPFIPEQPTIPVNELRPGMSGYILTVLKGTTPSKIPAKIVSIVPQKPGTYIPDNILVRLQGTKLAQGMSGSPLYIHGRLAGAIRSGWDNSDQTLALVTPIDAMCRAWDFEDSPRTAMLDTLALTNITVSGLNVNTRAMSALSRRLGVAFTQGGAASPGGLGVDGSRLRPGDSVAVMLVWGDVEIFAVGTVTATASDGRFLAFGHDMLKRGNSSYPSAGAYIHDIVNSSAFPFKLGSPRGINGTITQDRDAAIGGKFGYYAPSVSGEFVFRDLDRGTESRHKFRTIADEFMTDEVLENVFKGLAEEVWGRNGQGTMSVNLRIDGRNIPNGWARRDIFFSEENVIDEAFKQAKAVINAVLTQPFSGILPAGFTVTVEATQTPKLLMIEDVEAPEDARPGEEIEISVKLRGWRTEPVTRKFRMTIPEDATGVVELIVRGGGEQSFSQIAIEEGLKTMGSLERMLTEFRAEDANNELVLELNADRTGDILSRITQKRARKKTPSREPDFLPEEQEYMSETKERRIKEGTLKIYSSEYLIDGLMRRIIHTEN